MRKENEVTNALSAAHPNYIVRKPPGRRKVRGSVEYNSPTGRICFVLGYCDNCHHKVTATKQEMDELKLSVARQKTTFGYRMLTALLARYEPRD